MRKDSIHYTHVKEVDSTNALASRMLPDISSDVWNVFSTDTQLNGRGQRGTTWQDESGKNLLMTLLSPSISWPVRRVFDLNMCIALAIRRALSPYVDVQLKWPNDLWAGNLKLGGILIEPSVRGTFVQRLIIGLGLNVMQTEWGDEVRATSVVLQNENAPDIEALKHQISEAIVEELLKLFKTGASVKDEYLSLCLGYNRLAEYQDEERSFYATFIDVEETGKQVLKLQDGAKISFDLKEVKFLKLL